MSPKHNHHQSSFSSTSTASSKDYWEETIKGIANVLTHLRGTWYNNKNNNVGSTSTIGQEYRREKQQLEKYVQPFQYGFGAAMVLFLNFRITGNPRFQAWRQQLLTQWRQNKKQDPRQHQSSSSYNNKSGDPKSTTRMSNNANQNLNQKQKQQIPTTRQRRRPDHYPMMGYLESKREHDVKDALSSMRLITDILVSFSVGTSGTLWLLHAHQDTIRKDFEQAPLIKGRSVIAEQMCGPFLELSTPKGDDDDDDEEEEEENTSPNLVTFAKFRENCQKRRDIERQIRTQEGLSENVAVSIG